MPRRARPNLTDELKLAVRKMGRARHITDRRLLEIEAQVQALLDERDRLKKERWTNAMIADHFGIGVTTVVYIVNGRL